MSMRDDMTRSAHEDPVDGGSSAPWEPQMPDPVLAALVTDVIDGGLDAQKLANLESRLADDPAARRYYVDAMLIHSRLATTLSAANPTMLVDLIAAHDEPAAPSPPVGDVSRSHVLRRTAALLAVATALGSVGLWRGVTASLGIPENAFAEIGQTRFAIAAEAGGTLVEGRRVGRQRLGIRSGAVEIAVRNGAIIVVEGPAEFEVASETLVLLTKGTAVARLPSGLRGFVLETPTARIDAQGGEFGVLVDQDLTTDVQVYSGDVIASGDTKAGGGQFPLPVRPGHAMRFTSAAESAPEPLPFDERRFIRRLPPAPGRGMRADNLEKPADVLFGTPRQDSIVVTRAAGPVVADGLLDEWNADGVFRRARRGRTDDPEWIEGRMMYDDHNLYIAARVGDPAPMRNSVNPDLDPRLVWRGGALQLFLSVDRTMGWPADGAVARYFQDRRLVAGVADVQKAENAKLMSLVMWHHAPTGRDRLSVIKRMTGEEMTVDPEGAEGRFVQTADGKGYTLEYVIPWSALGADEDPPRSGDTLATAWELHLSDDSGRIWRDQIVEIRNLADPREIFLFERATTWGRAEFH